jgi:hypothetical protein
MRIRAAGFGDGAEFHASSRRDRIRGLVIWRIRVCRVCGAFADQAGA